LTDLAPGQAYKIYLLLLDGRSNRSSITSVSFTTLNTPVPDSDDGSGESNDSDLIFVIDYSNSPVDEINDNVSRFRATILNVTDTDSFIFANSISETPMFSLTKPIQLELIKQLIDIGGLEKFRNLLSNSENNSSFTGFDATFERIYGISIIDWYVKFAAPAVISSIGEQDSNALLQEIIDYEVSRTFVSSVDFEADLHLMDKSARRILRDVLATDGGLLKLQELIKASEENPDDKAQQSSFERVYGLTFNRWVESKGVEWMKEALGVPDSQVKPMDEPKYSILKNPVDSSSNQKAKNRGSLRERVFHV